MDAQRRIRILDSSAMIAYLRKEEGAAVVEQILTDPTIDCYAHAINLCEVYYDALRVSGVAEAEKSMQDLFALNVLERNDFDEAFWKEVAHLKAIHRASLADFCAVVLANRLNGVFLTADHHEFDKLAQDRVCSIQFIR